MGENDQRRSMMILITRYSFLTQDNISFKMSVRKWEDKNNK